MPHSHPDARILLAVAIEYLDSVIYPGLTGPERYRARVALNALRIVQRELELGPDLDREERADLRQLLGSGPGANPSLEDLIQHIEGGAGALDEVALRRVLRRNLARALAINNPRWIEPADPGTVSRAADASPQRSE